MTTFPYGYASPPGGGPQGMGTMLTWEQMLTKKTVYNLHPEVQRRFKALIEAAATLGIPLGCGTGWRVQPNPPPPGFAKPGNSWHESCPVSPAAATALAIDTVPSPSWAWLGANAIKFGFREFTYLKEPWHIQPYEISASRKYATVMPPLKTWDLPGTEPPPEPPTPTPPQPTGEVFTVQGYRKNVQQGTQGRMAKMCQQQINLLSGAGIAEDGNFGSQSVGALMPLQQVLGVAADGKCGPQTWQAMENGIKVQAEAGDWG